VPSSSRLMLASAIDLDRLLKLRAAIGHIGNLDA
jgi:hypothetical protein